MFFAGLTLGLLSGAILAKSTLTYTQMFGLGLALESLVFVYVFFAVKTVRDEDAVKGKSATDMFHDLLDSQHIKDAVSAVTKKRTGDNRKTLILLLVAHATLMAPMMGEMGVMYLFTKIKFNWDSGDLGTFMVWKMVTGFIGNFVSMGLLTQYLKLTDPAVGIAAAGSALLSNLLFAVSHTSFLFYLCPIVAILASAAMIVPRSIVSKIIPANEIGKVNSFLASLDSIVPLMSAPLYTVFYKSTFEVFPGAFFLMSAALSLIPILIFWRILKSGQFAHKKED
jgi:PCFT/HCP family folate transporter-like MFS transporter 1/3